MTNRTGIPYKGEIGDLAKAFDKMVDSIDSERQKLFTVIDELPGFAYLLSQDYSVRFSNKSFRELFGEPSGRACFEIIMGSEEPCPNCPSQEVFRSKAPYNWEITTHNGKTYNLFERLLSDIDGSLIVLKIGIDITEKKQAEIEIARLDRLNLVGQMAAGIAHEVRNPMTTVKGFLQFLKEKVDCVRFLEYFNIMIEELDRANSIISEYLEITKTKGSALQEHNINQLIKELEPLINSSVVEKGMNMKLELCEVPKLLLNKKEINQLLLNLVNNGIEAMLPGGTITIKTFTEGEKVVLAVQDQGKGIPQDVLDKLGTPFLTTKDQGTGLGLAVSYSIAARHNALIEVDTCSNGTTFRVLFSPSVLAKIA